jgi:hypothetical protein
MNHQPPARSAKPQTSNQADQTKLPANQSKSGVKKPANSAPTPQRNYRKWERYDALTREYWAIVGHE